MQKKPSYVELEQKIKNLEEEVSRQRQVEDSLREKEEWYNLLAQNINDVIWTVDKDLNFTYVSPSVIKFSGYTAEEMMKLSFIEQTTDKSSPSPSNLSNKELIKIFQTLCEQQNTSQLIREMEYFRKDGSKGWAEINMTFVADSKGIFAGIVGISREITERKEIQDIMDFNKKNYQQLLAIIENTSDFVSLSDLKGRMLYINQAGMKLVGRAGEDYRTSALSDYHPHSEFKKVKENLLPVMMEKGIWSDETRLLHKDGTLIPVSQVILLIKNKAGQPEALGTIIRDIRERNTARETLKEMNKKLKTANKQLLESMETAQQLALQAESASQYKSAFLANMSHELRTPLHGILSFAGFGIRRHGSAGPKKILDYFQKIETSGKTLLVLLNDLLDLAKLESGKMTFTFNPMELKKEIAVVVDELSSYVAERKITVDFSEPDFDSTVIFDKEKIRQVMRNLVSNATKFSPSGGVIKIDIKKKFDSFIITVQDHGPGIPESELETVFDKFIQSSSTHTKEGGTGLGLTICQEIISAHNGRIWAKNPPEGGTIISFEIPADPQKSRQAQIAEDRILR